MATSAILLVGGLGTRLQPLTYQTPKPMLPVAGIPFTEHQIAKARAAGITEIVLATSYLAEVFQPYFGDGERFGIDISYSVEQSPLGTGGAIAFASQQLKGTGPVVILNGDVLSSHDLRAQIELHSKTQADVTLFLIEVPDARAYGAVELDGDRILSFNEKMENPTTNIINAGCYIFNRAIIESIPTGRAVSVERETFPELLALHKKLIGYRERAYWLDIGTPSALLRATKDLISGFARSIAFDELLESSQYLRRSGSLVARDAFIDPSAVVEAGSVIAERARVLAQARVIGSVIGEGALIGQACSLEGTFVAPDCEIPAGFLANNQFFGFSA
jgi:mannose-1-phosphate guanylyltransferase